MDRSTHSVQKSGLPPHCQILFIVHNQGDQANAEREVEGWTSVAVQVPLMSRDFTEYGRIPRMSPWLLFAPTVRYAVGQDSRRVLSLSVADLLDFLRDKNNTLTASVLMLRSSGTVNLPEEAALTAGKFPNTAHQVAAYREYEQREQLSYDNVFDPELVVFDLQDAAARDFSCDWYREAQEWHPHGGSGHMAGVYVLARRLKEIATAAREHLSPQVRSALEKSTKSEWIPIAFRQDTTNELTKVSYLRLLENTHPFVSPEHHKQQSKNQGRRHLR